MQLIYGLATVNGGTLMPFEDSIIEVLGPGYSTHPTNIVCAYAKEGSIKVEVAYSKTSVEVYRFKTADSLQHYWSRSWKPSELIKNKKYVNMIKYLDRAYNTIFR